jgi:hypothetical protein
VFDLLPVPGDLTVSAFVALTAILALLFLTLLLTGLAGFASLLSLFFLDCDSALDLLLDSLLDSWLDLLLLSSRSELDFLELCDFSDASLLASDLSLSAIELTSLLLDFFALELL